MEITFTLPIPPSVNEAYLYQRLRRILTPKARKYKEEVEKGICSIGYKLLPKSPFRLELEVLLPANEFLRRDLDNCLKLPIDAVMKAASGDDRYCVELKIRKIKTEGQRHLIFKILEGENATQNEDRTEPANLRFLHQPNELAHETSRWEQVPVPEVQPVQIPEVPAPAPKPRTTSRKSNSGGPAESKNRKRTARSGETLPPGTN